MYRPSNTLCLHARATYASRLPSTSSHCHGWVRPSVGGYKYSVCVCQQSPSSLQTIRADALVVIAMPLAPTSAAKANARKVVMVNSLLSESSIKRVHPNDGSRGETGRNIHEMIALFGTLSPLGTFRLRRRNGMATFDRE